jgi:dihydroxyacetone kinase-like protein
MAANSLTLEMVLRWFQNCAVTFEQHKDELSQLDAAIGDADHGANMARGFSAVAAKLVDVKPKDIGGAFKTVAMTLISTVGGASGPLYGTIFLQAVAPANNKSELTPAEFAVAMEAGLKGVMNRGKAVVGDKTMVDALTPAVEKGADSTIPLVAKKGRASYLGERSAGHLDPGAASSVLLLRALQEAITPPV